MELSNGRASEGGESTGCSGGIRGGGARATQQARGNGWEWVWLPFRHSHLGTGDKLDNLIQFKSLMSIRENVKNVTRGLFVLKTAGDVFSQLRIEGLVFVL